VLVCIPSLNVWSAVACYRFSCPALRYFYGRLRFTLEAPASVWHTKLDVFVSRPPVTERSTSLHLLKSVWAFPVLLAICIGCDQNAQKPTRAPGPALYGELTAKPPTSIRPARPNSADKDWQQAPFAVIETELSPATLFHCASNRISFFTHLADRGLGAPSYAACATRTGIKIYKPGEAIKADWIEECWVLVWFSGAKGWTNWDSPWAVYMQRKPSALSLDGDGLHFRFEQAAGDLVLLPLYGYYKLPLAKTNYVAGRASLNKKEKLKTWEWSTALARDPLMRVRYWASALREFPLYCEDSFSVDRAKDTVTIRQRFDYLSINDDWNTPHIKLAPISPPLALAQMDKQFPGKFSKPVFNHEYFTPYGPYMGIEDDHYDTTFPVLQYVNETEASDSPDPNSHPTVKAALERLQKVTKEKFRSAEKYDHDHGSLENFCWAIQGDEWYPKALPYMDLATRNVALASLRKYFRDDVLVTNRFKLREFPTGSGHEYFILEGPGIGSWGALGDAGKLSTSMLQTLWAYAHYSGDWDLIKERWDLIRKLFCTPVETRWVGFGRNAIAELGDQAAPCIAMARMAYKVGDIDTYNYACSIFARELVHHYMKQRGADYFRKNQPWHSMESMDDEVYLTNLWGDVAGWQIDGPNYPRQSSERQYNNRWVRFKHPDVGRFYGDYLKPDVAHELDLLQGRWDPKRRYQNDSHITPSLVQLRSLLLNQSPAELALVATPDQFSGPPSGILGSCLSILRTSHPIRYERLIPPAAPSPFVTGLERDVPGPNVYLVQAVQTGGGETNLRWPEITWWKSWKTPTGDRWSFGQVELGTNAPVGTFKLEPLNWNSQALVLKP